MIKGNCIISFVSDYDIITLHPSREPSVLTPQTHPPSLGKLGREVNSMRAGYQYYFIGT